MSRLAGVTLASLDGSTSPKMAASHGIRTKRVGAPDRRLQFAFCRNSRAALDAMRPSAALTFLTNDYGKPFASAAAFGNKFADWCRKAGIEGVIGDDQQLRNFRAHGLRKAACVRLAEAGCTAPEIMAVSGHRTLGQVQIYIEEGRSQTDGRSGHGQAQ